jgi:hypothetical protein
MAGVQGRLVWMGSKTLAVALSGLLLQFGLWRPWGVGLDRGLGFGGRGLCLYNGPSSLTPERFRASVPPS